MRFLPPAFLLARCWREFYFEQQALPALAK